MKCGQFYWVSYNFKYKNMPFVALRNLYSRKSIAKDECRQEIWQQTLRFLMAVDDHLLSKPVWPGNF